MKIKNAIIRKIYDSRSQPTVEIGLVIGNGRKFFAELPAGKSRGRNEAVVADFPKAVRGVKNLVAPRLRNKGFASVRSFDELLLGLDRTKNKSRLGGNVALGLSIAFIRALAFAKKAEPWQIINKEFFERKRQKNRPSIFSNFINGGAHAENNLKIQEYLVIARPQSSYGKTVAELIRLYRLLGRDLRRYLHLKNVPIGDESGYSADFSDDFGPIKALENLIRGERGQGNYSLGLDAAASGFYRRGYYLFEGRQTAAGLMKKYLSYFHKSPLLEYIEDPFDERDYVSFQKLLAATTGRGKWIAGDDLTTTDSAAIARFAKGGLINAVIIKPNQIGTVSETCDAIRAARNNGLKIIISHRSGETEDNFIIQLARASGADGVKIGAPSRERIFKFNELIRVFDY